MPFPAIKIAALLVRTLSKPVAKSLKSYVATHPVSEKYIAELGRMSHRFWAEVTIRAAGHKGLRIKPIEDEKAISQGADAFSEIFIFSVAGICIVAELGRNHVVKTRQEKISIAKSITKETELQNSLIQIEEKLSLIELKQQQFRELLS